jgi:hypothetical protein
MADDKSIREVPISPEVFTRSAGAEMADPPKFPSTKDQRVDELAKACAVRFYSHADSCDSHEDLPCDCGLENYRERMAAFVAAAIREALSSQEEELQSLREERDQAMEVLSGGRTYFAEVRDDGQMRERPTTLLERAINVASAAESEAEVANMFKASWDAAKAELQQLRSRVKREA